VGFWFGVVKLVAWSGDRPKLWCEVFVEMVSRLHSTRFAVTVLKYRGNGFP
jgi:hypothetical protein